MAICEITGKGKMYGHNVSFSQRHTRKVFKPNVSKRTLIINGQKVKCNVSTSALRTLKKKGLIESPKARADKKTTKEVTIHYQKVTLSGDFLIMSRQ